MNDKESIRAELLARWQGLWPDGADQPRPPLFAGHNRAAERLRRQPEYLRARTILVMADPVLLQVRINALQDGKTLLAPTPGLKQGLVRVNPGDLPLQQRSRLLRGGSLTQAGQLLRLPQSNLGRIDLLVAPVVAVDGQGVTLGDGRGLADVLAALLRRVGALPAQAPVAVLAAPEQILEQPLPREPWDLLANLVVTPDQAIRHPADPAARAWLGQLPPRLAGLPLLKALLALPAKD